MKNILYFLGSLIIALTAAFLIHLWLSDFNDPGYVLIGLGHWSLETSAVVFAIGLVFLFFIAYLFFRGLGWLVRLPGRLKDRGKNVKFNRSQDALIAGLVDSAEGNWAKAEKVLIKHASHSGAPLIHYLTAARAAQSRGATSKRDEYLELAKQESPGSDLVVGLTEAELHLSEKQFDQALKTLTKLQSIDPNHASVLKLLHQTYASLGDWESVRRLIPSLDKNKVIMEAEVKLLEAETFSGLLKKAAANGNAKEIESLWDDVPAHVKVMKGISAIYFAAMIEAEAGAQIEHELAKTLESKWNDTLLVLYGSVQSNNPLQQLTIAESWLGKHGEHPLLLRVLGKICLKCDLLDKAEQYLSKSIRLEATVPAYQMLGDVLFAKGDKDNAAECYKSGLELVSSEVVSRVEAEIG